MKMHRWETTDVRKHAATMETPRSGSAWELFESKMIPDDTSDHCPLVCRFRVRP